MYMDEIEILISQCTKDCKEYFYNLYNEYLMSSMENLNICHLD